MLLLGGCAAPTAVSSVPQLPQAATPATPVLSTNTPLPLPTNLPPATSTPVPTSTPLPTATAVPITIAMPPQWETRIRTALADPALAAWAWQVQSDPALPATMRLQPGNDGLIIGQEPLALAVPFTTAWEVVSLTEANEIVQHGHALVTVLPWSEIEPTQKALRVDGRFPTDPDYPLQQNWTLTAAPGTEQAAAALAAILQAQPSAETLVHLAAVGDLMLDRSLGYYLAQDNLDYPFTHVRDLLATADITVGNLECALGDSGTPTAKSYTFRAPPQAAAALALAGFDVITLANNHAGDYGLDALMQGVDLLHAAGLATIGAGANETAAHAPHIVTINGLTLAFLGYVDVPVEAIGGFNTASWTATANTPGLAWAEPAQIERDVTAVAPQVDHVIIVLHGGYEYVDSPSPPQVAAAHAAIDAGAALVIGHHAHILQGIEYYNGGVIVYGLGNFAFEIDGPPETAILNVWLDQNGVRQLELLPAVIQFGGQPRPAEAWEAPAILQRVYALTNALNAP
ncbi:MAG: CapA family protein [Chloroflexota bacterium]